ncbi:MAG: hypothetical protein ACRDZ8_04135 [Acidimicrobiales bacterium]
MLAVLAVLAVELVRRAKGQVQAHLLGDRACQPGRGRERADLLERKAP